MARHEGELKAAGEATFGLREMLGAGSGQLSDRERQDAVVCYLSRSDGWQDALKLLGGAFAPEPMRHDRVNDR